MTYVFDIDGTVCSITEGDYSKAEPIQDRIDKINKLYESGNTIIFHTARGMGRSGNSASFAHRLLYKKTLKQLNGWGIKFHELFMGKPSGDIYIDDKGVRDEDYFNTKD